MGFNIHENALDGVKTMGSIAIMKKLYFLLLLIFGLALVISCKSSDGETSISRLYSKTTDDELAARAFGAWNYYAAGKYGAALSEFGEILNSGGESFIKKRAAELGLHVGLGFSLLQFRRYDEALYQFEYDIAVLPESAVGAATVYYIKRDYTGCVKSFDHFKRLYNEQFPYTKTFPALNFEVNLESHKFLFLGFYFQNSADLAANASAQYEFLAGHTAEVGISSEADKIFSKTVKKP